MHAWNTRLPAAMWVGCALALTGCASDSSSPPSGSASASESAVTADRTAPGASAAAAIPARSAAAAPAVRSSTPAANGDEVHRYIDAMRSELSSGKVQLITDVMRLNATEAGKFWPIYQEYEDELFDLGDQRLDGMRAFVEAQQNGALDDKTAADLADRFFAFEDGRLALLKKYHGMLSKELSPVRAAQFTQIEHRVGTAMDLMIASQMPLIRHGTTPTALSMPRE